MKTSQKFDKGTTRTVVMDTKPKDWTNQIRHNVEFDFSGCTIEHVMSLAIDAMKVKIAGPIRTSPSDYPAGDLKYKVSALGGRQKAQVVITDEMLAAALAKMTQDERDALGTPEA